MKVFKFGGASVSTKERIQNVAAILRHHRQEPLVVVISAMGKTTNALEKVVATFYNNEQETALRLFEQIKQEHLQTAAQLTATPVRRLADFFTEVEWLLYDKPAKNFDYYYDQIVCIGELLSTAIISHYLNEQGIANKWIDVRDMMRTDDTFRDARIDWTITAEKIQSEMLPLFQKHACIITQGFIGATDENESTTLGREGSDYTAAVFANLLAAESQTIWKDVPGVMNADPKQYPQAQMIPELNYREVIEMAYYGAQVIHPKTIKPLQNKNIPLHVKSFIQPDAQGSIIHNKSMMALPPIIVYKYDQVVVQLSSKDYSFVSEGLIGVAYDIFERVKCKPNLTQNGAISLLCVLDDVPQKVDAFALAASQQFDVSLTKNLTLLTIRHYNDAIVQELTAGKKIILQQQTGETLQVLFER